MTPLEAGEKIILWWQMDLPLPFMAFWVTMLYAPLTVKDVLAVVRRYVDLHSENIHPKRGEIIWRNQ